MLKLRNAIFDDYRILFEWVNDKDVRKSSFNTQKISMKEHITWLKKKLNDNRCSIFIIYNECNIPIGQIRIDFEESIGEIDYSIDYKFRGNGFGYKILELIKKRFENIDLIGRVKLDNISSIKSFEKAGYIKILKSNYVEFHSIFNLNKIAIRADGGNNIGMGHVMRCMAIAKELLERNIKVFFISKFCKEVNDIFINQGIKFINIYSDNLDDEILEIEKIIKNSNIDCVITDSYNLSEDYLFKMKQLVRLLVSIDDNSLYRYPSNIIINGNIYANNLDYKLMNKDTKLLLGSEYCILREEFRKNFNFIVEEKIKNILITMGGSDINNFTPFVLDTIKHLNVNINVIIGKSFKCINEIQEIYKKYNNINLIYNPSNISEIMKNNDIAISASGSTAYELCKVGVPAILIVQAENQENIACEFDKKGIMINMGYFSDLRKGKLLEKVNFLIDNKEARYKMNNLSKNVMHSDGVKNIVDNILNY